MSKPLFIHDCDNDVFVGRFRTDNYSEVDAYVHPPVFPLDSDSNGSVILRDGNEGHEYASTPLFIVLDEKHYPSDNKQIVLYRKVWQQFLTLREAQE